MLWPNMASSSHYSLHHLFSYQAKLVLFHYLLVHKQVTFTYSSACTIGYIVLFVLNTSNLWYFTHDENRSSCTARTSGSGQDEIIHIQTKHSGIMWHHSWCPRRSASPQPPASPGRPSPLSAVPCRPRRPPPCTKLTCLTLRANRPTQGRPSDTLASPDGLQIAVPSRPGLLVVPPLGPRTAGNTGKNCVSSIVRFHRIFIFFL